MSYFVYILYSKIDFNLYTGCTSNVELRVKRHNGGHVLATKNRRPLVLIYVREFDSKTEAFNYEIFLKTKWGNTFKQRVKRFYLNKISHTNG